MTIQPCPDHVPFTIFLIVAIIVRKGVKCIDFFPFHRLAAAGIRSRLQNSCNKYVTYFPWSLNIKLQQNVKNVSVSLSQTWATQTTHKMKKVELIALENYRSATDLK